MPRLKKDAPGIPGIAGAEGSSARGARGLSTQLLPEELLELHLRVRATEL